jgi:hypothetical protein
VTRNPSAGAGPTKKCLFCNDLSRCGVCIGPVSGGVSGGDMELAEKLTKAQIDAPVAVDSRLAWRRRSPTSWPAATLPSLSRTEPKPERAPVGTRPRWSTPAAAACGVRAVGPRRRPDQWPHDVDRSSQHVEHRHRDARYELRRYRDVYRVCARARHLRDKRGQRAHEVWALWTTRQHRPDWQVLIVGNVLVVTGTRNAF